MQKCFYHPRTDAVTMCMGCKMPICPACRDEGKRGFCERCIKKVASLGEQVADLKKTGMFNAKKATIVKSARPPGEPDAAHCFHHFDIMASAKCPTCNRPFCPACLNTAGICSHCVMHSAEAQERLFSPTERGRAIAEDRPRHRPSRPAAPRTFFERHRVPLAAAGAVVLLLLLSLAFRHGPSRASQASQDLDNLHAADLSVSEQAMVSKLAKQADHIASQRDTGGAQGSVMAHGTVGAPAGALAGAGPVHIAIYAPSSGTQVSGMTTIKARAAGPLDHIELAVDGQWQGALNAAPYNIDWASQSVSNGTHRVTLTAIGTNGREAVSSVLLRVHN